MTRTLALRLFVDNDGKCMLMDEPFYRQHRILKSKLYSLGLEESPLPPEITVRALNLSNVAHKPVGKIHTGNCSFTDDWGLALVRNLISSLREYDVNRGEGETEGSNFRNYMDRAVQEVGNFDCFRKPLSGRALNLHIKEVLELCPMKSSK
ncbi:uncharacterized protein EAF01_003873 [Botrytis porri]|uniref:uncharacterized protein n=1 Tax=Botrytis porri TaxID=87229 RepID=UPI001900FDA9|nr:uncharacterized protein EAF01_003873 [Botrytis porri]KAF7908118.1 hypothetical protein EAF01_003873 [Botrytis porri]